VPFQHFSGTAEPSTIAEQKRLELWRVKLDLMEVSPESFANSLELPQYRHRERRELTNTNTPALALSFDSVICDGSALVVFDGHTPGVLRGIVRDLADEEGRPVAETHRKVRDYLESILQSSRSKSSGSNAPVFPVAAMPCTANEEDKGEFSDRIVAHLHVIASIAACSEGWGF
jgi:hypothetical protein